MATSDLWAVACSSLGVRKWAPLASTKSTIQIVLVWFKKKQYCLPFHARCSSWRVEHQGQRLVPQVKRATDVKYLQRTTRPSQIQLHRITTYMRWCRQSSPTLRPEGHVQESACEGFHICWPSQWCDMKTENLSVPSQSRLCQICPSPMQWNAFTNNAMARSGTLGVWGCQVPKPCAHTHPRPGFYAMFPPTHPPRQHRVMARVRMKRTRAYKVLPKEARRKNRTYQYHAIPMISSNTRAFGCNLFA